MISQIISDCGCPPILPDPKWLPDWLSYSSPPQSPTPKICFVSSVRSLLDLQARRPPRPTFAPSVLSPVVPGVGMPPVGVPVPVLVSYRGLICSLVGRITPTPATVATAVAATRGEPSSASVEATSTPEATSSASSTHPGDVGPFGNDLVGIALARSGLEDLRRRSFLGWHSP